MERLNIKMGGFASYNYYFILFLSFRSDQLLNTKWFLTPIRSFIYIVSLSECYLRRFRSFFFCVRLCVSVSMASLEACLALSLRLLFGQPTYTRLPVAFCFFGNTYRQHLDKPPPTSNVGMVSMEGTRCVEWETTQIEG